MTCPDKQPSMKLRKHACKRNVKMKPKDCANHNDPSRIPKHVSSCAWHPVIHFCGLRLAHKSNKYIYQVRKKDTSEKQILMQRSLNPQPSDCELHQKCPVLVQTSNMKMHVTTKFWGSERGWPSSDFHSHDSKKNHHNKNQCYSYDGIEGHGDWNFSGSGRGAHRFAAARTPPWALGMGTRGCSKSFLQCCGP